MGTEKEMDGCTWKMKELKMVEVSSSGGSRDFVGDSKKRWMVVPLITQKKKSWTLNHISSILSLVLPPMKSLEHLSFIYFFGSWFAL